MLPLRLKKGRDAAIAAGMPWIYAADIIASSELLSVTAGELVSIETHKGARLGTGYYNAASQIAARVLTLKNETVDTGFFRSRVQAALARRENLVDVPYYRLAHAEADGLPGLLIDRFGDTLVIQAGTAGMERLQPLWLEALEDIVTPKTIILRNDTPARKLEGLKQEISVVKGTAVDFTEVHENGLVYYADLLKGQKTGWFYDQRDNHALVAELSKGKTVLDMYSHSGGFGLLAAARGAAAVTMADSSNLALSLAKKAQAKNRLEACGYIQGDAFEVMEKLAREGKTYDIVVADPPPFVKTKRDIGSGLKGYEKMARLSAALVSPGGYMFAASCSHHASRSAFLNAVQAGIAKAGRRGEGRKHTGVAADHPIHPRLPQSEYLKGLLVQLD